jgi:hypothetical protein
LVQDWKNYANATKGSGSRKDNKIQAEMSREEVFCPAVPAGGRLFSMQQEKSLLVS